MRSVRTSGRSSTTTRRISSSSATRTRLDDETGALETTELDAFINDRWLITVRKDEGFTMDRVLARWDRSPDLAREGVSFLLYGLLDVVVDGYFDTVSVFDEFYDSVSEGLFAETPMQPSEQKHWFVTRQSLIKFHRLVIPMREAVSGLMRREHSSLDDDIYPYFQDVYDHVLRVSESTDSLRDLDLDTGRDQPQPARVPHQPGDEEGDELGGDHRRADADHGLVRDERALPRLGADLGHVGRSRGRADHVECAVLRLPA